MKKIALDLDGVIFDSENLYRVCAEMHDVDNFKSDNIIDNSLHKFEHRYSWTKDESDSFYKQIVAKVLSTAHLMTGVELVIKELMKKYEMIIVTARSKEELDYSKDKLSLIGLDKVKIFHNESNKVDVFLQENCNFMIDDNYNICKEAADNGIKSIYFKNPCAKIPTDIQNIKVVNNWGEIYKYLMLED